MYDDPADSPPPHAPMPAGELTDVDPVSPAPWNPLTAERSPNASVCPFLCAVDDTGDLVNPVEAPDPMNRCAALHDPVPQSLRQQELVCLSSGHVNCPRYLRGSPEVALGPVTNRAITTRAITTRTIRPVTPATGGSLVLLAAAFLLSVGFVVANGGIELSAAATPPPSGGVLAEVETAAPTATATAAATPSPTPLPTPSPTPLPTASPTPAVTPSPVALATPEPTPKATPRPTSGRYALLKPCPDKPKCWIYVIRSGDNLFSIAKYFGVSLNTVKAWNPWVNNGLTVGRELRIPPPTR